MARKRKQPPSNTPPPPEATTIPPSSSSSENKGSIFFYGHKSPPFDFLSQHYLSTFTCPSPTSPSTDLTFTSCEQYMMHQKALLFNDPSVAEMIMNTQKPQQQKRLGRQVRGFTEDVWKENRERIVEDGTWLKFTAAGNEKLRERLLATGSKELVEASPRDRVWGIGFGKAGAEANRTRWGLNLLGKALMKVRDRLRAQEDEGKQA